MSGSTSHPILTLHIGQAGIQMGHAAWELLCLEHNIQPDGAAKPECGDFFGNRDAVFLNSPNGFHYPRSIFVDTDPACLAEIRGGPYRGLFNSRQLISDHRDSGVNYATGRYGFANHLLPSAIDRLRWLLEKSDASPTIFLMHSSGGGTGSGFAVALLTGAAEELGVRSRSVADICLIPGETAAQSCCELLNTALFLDESQLLVRQTFCVSNSALFRVCSSQLHSNGAATYAHANRLVATAFSNLTATERLPGSNVSLQGLLENLLPFEHFRYPAIACASFLTADLARMEQVSARSVAAAVLEPGSQFLDLDPRTGSHASGFLLFRGQTSPSEAQRLAAELTVRGQVKFHDWAPAGFRTGVVTPPPLAPPGSGWSSPAVSVTMLTNHSGISKIFSRLSATAKRLHDADLFIHSYEGAVAALLSKGEQQQQPFSGNNDMEAPSTSRSSQKLSLWMSGGSLQQQQQQPELQQEQPLLAGRMSLEKQRTGLSDVFGVRHRLMSAISYLDSVAVNYAADATAVAKAATAGADGGEDKVGGDGGEDVVQFVEPSTSAARRTDSSEENIRDQLLKDSAPSDASKQQKEQKSLEQSQPFNQTTSNSTSCQKASWTSRVSGRHQQLKSRFRRGAAQLNTLMAGRKVREVDAPNDDPLEPSPQSAVVIAEVQHVLYKYHSHLSTESSEQQ